MAERTFLFLQGPSSPFFAHIADGLGAMGHKTLRINLCVGDQLFWRREGATNYRGRLSEWPGFIAGYLDRHQVTDLVLLGEQREHHKLAIEAAKARGIDIVVTDFGYLRPDWIILEKDGMSASSLLPREPEAIRDLARLCPPADLGKRYEDSFWRMAFAEMAYHLSSHFLWWLFPHYESFKIENPIAAYLGTGWRLLHARAGNREAEEVVTKAQGDGRGYFLFPLQMENDFQIRAYSHYPDMEAPIAEVITSFANRARQSDCLIIKLHPWDPGLKNWRRIVRRLAIAAGIGDRVHFIDGGNLNAMIPGSRGMVTINSTSGLHALRMDSPVKVLGEAIFDVPGLTFQGALDDFWTQSCPPDKELRDAYINVIAAMLQIRGVYFRQAGLQAAVAAAVRRLDGKLINAIVAETDS